MSSQFIGVFSVGTTLDRGLRLYKLTFKRVFSLLLVPVMIGMLPYLSGINLLSPRYSAFQISVMIINMFVGAWAYCVIIRYLQKVAMGESPSVSQMLKLSGPRDLFLLFTYLLWGVMMVISMLLLIIPAVYVGNVMLVGFMVAITERQYFFGGISRTFSLIKGRWWKTFGVNFIAFLIVVVPYMIGMAIMSSMMLVSMKGSGTMDSSAAPSGIFMLIGVVINSLIVALVFPVFSSVTLVHYNSLRCEKESFDLEKSIETIGEASVQNKSATV